MGRKNDIEETIDKATEFINSLEEKNSIQIAKFYNKLGQRFRITEYKEVSRKLFAKSFEVLMSISNKNSVEIANCYDNLAYEACEYSEAEKIIEHALKSINIKTNLNLDPVNIAKNNHQLGKAYLMKKDYKIAELYLLLAIELLEKGNSDKDTLIDCLTGLAHVYRFTKRFADSEKLLNRLILNWGENHPNSARLYGNLGDLYSDMVKTKKAIRSYRKAIEINGQDNPDNSHYYAGLGVIYRCLGGYEYALKEDQMAIEVRNKGFGDKDQEIGHFYYRLAHDYKKLKNWALALEFYEKGIQSFLLNNGDKDFHIGEGYLYIGELYLKKRDKATALNNFRKAEAIFENFPGEFREKGIVKKNIKNLIESQ